MFIAPLPIPVLFRFVCYFFCASFTSCSVLYISGNSASLFRLYTVQIRYAYMKCVRLLAIFFRQYSGCAAWPPRLLWSFVCFFFSFFAAIRRRVAMADRLFLSMLLLLFSHSPRTRNLVGGYFFNIKSLEFDGRDPCIFLNFLRLCVCRFIFILTTNDLSKWFMIGNVVGVGNILYPKHVPI